jgi:glycosyltransferase involved in cell wall biosynthesis
VTDAPARLRVGLIGTRGVPASYSGFETCAEELGARLAARGHAVTVYCRVPHVTYPGDHYRGMRLVKLPTIRSKHLDTIVHALLSSLHALRQGYDVALYFNVGVSPLTWIPRLAGQRVVLNVDGLDSKRKKWGGLARAYIRACERWAARLPDRVVTDSRRVQRYYRDRYGTDSDYIAYGAEPVTVAPGPTLARWGLEPRRYLLFVGRLVPENCVHHLVEAFADLPAPFRCVIVGDSPYSADYIRRLKAAADPRVVFTGYLFGEGCRELLANAYAFVEPSEVGGTHPALLEAMAAGCCVVVNDTPENLETVGDAGLSYEGSVGSLSLRDALARLLKDPALTADFGARGADRVRRHYSWDDVTDRYERLFRDLVGGSARAR